MPNALFTALSLALLSAPAWAQNLVVEAGERLVIDGAQQQLNLETLRLGDGATLILSPDVSEWKVRAEQAWIGRNVNIIADGKNGDDGPSGPAVQTEPTTACDKGVPGIKGERGRDGQPGLSLNLELGLMHFESLSIQANGGHGGRGGVGGIGGAGGEADDCHAGAGGDGGDGGDGGSGGHGGKVQVVYWSADRKTFIPVSNYGPGIHIENYGGDAGDQGEGGPGGKGGHGGWEKRATGRKISRNPGPDGRDGQRGKRGKAGRSGRFLVQPIAPPGEATGE